MECKIHGYSFSTGILFEKLKGYIRTYIAGDADENFRQAMVNLSEAGQTRITTNDAKQYAKIMRENYVARIGASLAQEKSRAMESDSSCAKETMSELTREFSRLTEQLDEKEEEDHISFALEESIQEIDKRIRGDMSGIIPTGFTELDEMIGNGLGAGDLVVLGGSTSAGKTSIAANITYNIASQGIPALYFNLEMTRKQLADRLLIPKVRILNTQLRSGKVSGEEMNRILDAKAELLKLPLYQYSKSGITVDEIIAKTKEKHRKNKVSFVVVDYVQRVRTNLKARQRHEELDYITQELKSLANELKISILCLAQLNDEVIRRENNTPQMSDIRESKSMAHDCDNVWLLHRPEYYLKDKRPPEGKVNEIMQWEQLMESLKGVGEIIVAKNRHGALGRVRLRFEHQFMHYQNPTY
jgi:replicative DNA helicase